MTAPEAERELPGLLLLGDFPTRVTVIPRALCTLIMNMGIAEESAGRRHVLLPNIEMKFAGIRQGDLDDERGPDDQDLEELFSRILPLENALWLLSDMASDIRIACLRLKSVAGEANVLEPVRIANARDYAERLRQQAELTFALLDDLVPPRSESSAAATLKSPATRRPKKLTRKGE